MNTNTFLANQRRYFDSSYKGFQSFGGPSVYFHEQCLRAGQAVFLSDRHLEMLYATLTSWGMHRMGDPESTKTKLRDWPTFSQSIASQASALAPFREQSFLRMTVEQYSEVITALRPTYTALNLSISDATVVVNSKALFHLLPDLIPPIDRQFTVRFFKQPPDRWLDKKGKFRMVNLPGDFEKQFKLFRDICVSLKRLADRVEPDLFRREQTEHGVPAPKALDNAIVNYIRIVSSAV